MPKSVATLLVVLQLSVKRLDGKERQRRVQLNGYAIWYPTVAAQPKYFHVSEFNILIYEKFESLTQSYLSGTMSHLDDSTHVTNPNISTDLLPPRQVLPRRKNPDPDIDFDGASHTWYENKVRRGYMIYYRCAAIQKNGNQCAKPVLDQCRTVCKLHLKSASPGGKLCGGSVSSPMSSLHLLTTQ